MQWGWGGVHISLCSHTLSCSLDSFQGNWKHLKHVKQSKDTINFTFSKDHNNCFGENVLDLGKDLGGCPSEK